MMKKVKIVFWLLVLGVVALVIAQNLDFFLQRQEIMINIGFVSYHTPNWAMAIYLLFFFFAGILVAFLFGLAEKFRSKKSIRVLTENLDAEKKKVLELDAKLAAIRNTRSQDIYSDTKKQPDAVAS
jgi:hypothetical protein